MKKTKQQVINKWKPNRISVVVRACSRQFTSCPPRRYDIRANDSKYWA